MKASNLGVGIDIEDIGRFQKKGFIKNKLLLNKIFAETELNYCFGKKDPAQHLAARFAGKEAIIKALSSIGKEIPDLNEIEIHNNKEGLPLARINKIPDIEIKISLSHCNDKATAFAIAIKSEENETNK